MPSLASAYASKEQLASAVLDALAARNHERLEALALTEEEFKEQVWPQLPSARPERNLPSSYVWGDLRQKSLAGLATTLADFGGKRYTLERVNFTGQTDYSTYRVHRSATLDVRDASGTRLSVKVCGSMIEKDGTWKVFSYVVDD